LADSFISKSRTGTGVVYTVPTADQNSQPPILPTTAIVKSIFISNETGGAVTTTVAKVDSSNGNLEIPLYKDSAADGFQDQVLKKELVLEEADQIKITGSGVIIDINILEMTQ
tara:strand:- start:1427 stop:1765 length:339 start_codon:yes stop_codon:yes gene_type:complete